MYRPSDLTAAVSRSKTSFVCQRPRMSGAHAQSLRLRVGGSEINDAVKLDWGTVEEIADFLATGSARERYQPAGSPGRAVEEGSRLISTGLCASWA